MLSDTTLNAISSKDRVALAAPVAAPCDGPACATRQGVGEALVFPPLSEL